MFSWEYPPRVIGGLARHVAELSMALQAENTQVDVITIDEEGTQRAEIIAGCGVAHTPYQLGLSAFYSIIYVLEKHWH